MTENAMKVLDAICYLNVYCFDASVFKSQWLADRANLSRYKTLKALHELRDLGYVQRGSQGCPAIESGYEYRELECEAAPPVNGWKLTSLGTECESYQKWCDKQTEEFKEMCNRNYEGE